MRVLAKAMAVLGSALGIFLSTASIGFWVITGRSDSTDLGASIGFGAMIMFIAALLSVYVACVVGARLFAGIGLREFFLGSKEA